MKTHPPRLALRAAFSDFLSSGDWTHAVTLNAERELSPGRLRSIFGTFCMLVDRRIHGKQRITQIPSRDRFHAIAVPEHLTTNAHLHVSADFRSLAKALPRRINLQKCIHDCWKQASRTSGSVYITEYRTRGWGGYQLKGADWVDPLYFHSWDFHPY